MLVPLVSVIFVGSGLCLKSINLYNLLIKVGLGFYGAATPISLHSGFLVIYFQIYVATISWEMSRVGLCLEIVHCKVKKASFVVKKCQQSVVGR